MASTTVGLLAEMALGDDTDLVQLPIDGLPVCSAYALLRRDRVVRDYVIDFLAALAPHLNRRDLVRGLQPGGRPLGRNAPEWREWQTLAEGRSSHFEGRQAAA
jgi:hypothetical protein